LARYLTEDLSEVHLDRLRLGHGLRSLPFDAGLPFRPPDPAVRSRFDPPFALRSRLPACSRFLRQGEYWSQYWTRYWSQYWIQYWTQYSPQISIVSRVCSMSARRIRRSIFDSVSVSSISPPFSCPSVTRYAANFPTTV